MHKASLAPTPLVGLSATDWLSDYHFVGVSELSRVRQWAIFMAMRWQCFFPTAMQCRLFLDIPYHRHRCDFFGSTIGSNGFAMVFQFWEPMVCDGWWKEASKKFGDRLTAFPSPWCWWPVVLLDRIAMKLKPENLDQFFSQQFKTSWLVPTSNIFYNC